MMDHRTVGVRILESAVAVRETARRAARGELSLDHLTSEVAELGGFDFVSLARWDNAEGRHLIVGGADPPRLTEYVENQLHLEPLFARVVHTHESLWLSTMPDALREMAVPVREAVYSAGMQEGTTQCLFSRDGRYVGMLNIACTATTSHGALFRPAIELLLDVLADAIDRTSWAPWGDRTPSGQPEVWTVVLPVSRTQPLFVLDGTPPTELLQTPTSFEQAVRAIEHRRPLPTTVLVPYRKQVLRLHISRIGLAIHVVGEAIPRPAGLSARELEVMAALTRGHTNHEISELLSITPRTVATHIEHILTKLNLPNRVAVAAHASDWGLVGLHSMSTHR